MMTAEQYVGQPIRSLQTMLRTIAHADETLVRLVPDGIYGPNTVQAVREFQRQQELPSREKRTTRPGTRSSPFTREKALPCSRPRRCASGGHRIRCCPRAAGIRICFLCRRCCRRWGGFSSTRPPVRATGVHDAASVAAVRWLQKLSGLPQTGAIDQTTWAYLSGLYTLTTGTGDPTPPR